MSENYKEEIKKDIWEKKEEGEVKQLTDDQVIISVDNNKPEQVKSIDKDDKDDFENFKTLYKGVIDIKCKQDFGSTEDTSLWQDTAKELFLKNKYYFPKEDDLKPTKIEESKELAEDYSEEKPLIGKDVLYVFEEFDTGVDKNQENLIKYVNDDLKLGLDPVKNELDIAFEIQKMPGKQVINLIRLCYGDEIADRFEIFLNDTLLNLDTDKIEYISLDALTEGVEKEMNAIEFVELCDKLKGLGLWDGKDETFKTACNKLYDIEDVDKKLNEDEEIKKPSEYDIENITEVGDALDRLYDIMLEGSSDYLNTKWREKLGEICDEFNKIVKDAESYIELEESDNKYDFEPSEQRYRELVTKCFDWIDMHLASTDEDTVKNQLELTPEEIKFFGLTFDADLRESKLEERVSNELIAKLDDPQFHYLAYFADHVDDIEKVIDTCTDKSKVKEYKQILKSARAFNSGRTKTESIIDKERYQLRKFLDEYGEFKGQYGVYDTVEDNFVQKGSKKVMQAAVTDLNNKID